MSKVYTLDDLLYLMARLRDPVHGCPWDKAQTMQTILPSSIEEVYELADAILQNDSAQIQEELGDVLFQVVFYAQIAAEQNTFDFSHIVHSLADKLVRRHPHVFANGDLYASVDEKPDVAVIKAQWDAIKAQERESKAKGRLLDDVPEALPALKRAQKLQKRAASVGFDWPDALSALSKIREEVDELEQAIREGHAQAMEEELGDLLFSCVNVARHIKADAEFTAVLANRKFEQRFNFIEQQIEAAGGSLAATSLADMNALWQQSKVSVKK